MIKDRIVTFLDLETTGSKAGRDRVIEIGIVQYLNGEVICEFESLIHPECEIPGMITSITGISDSDVASAPIFKEIALKLYEMIEDTILVAHNVSFDYSFLRAEFSRLGVNLNNDVLCSVKLSRDLYPEFKKHSLDSIIDRFGLSCERRHRALDDAKIIFEFVQCAVNDHTYEEVAIAFSKNLKVIKLPPNLNPKDLNKLPATPGVYIFKSQNSEILYISSAKNIYLDTTGHFLNQSIRRESILSEVVSVDCMPSFGEIGAAVLEVQLSKKLKPVYSKKFKPIGKYLPISYDESLLPWWPTKGFVCVEEKNGKEGQLFIFSKWKLVAIANYTADTFELDYLKDPILDKSLIDLLSSRFKYKSGFKFLTEFEFKELEAMSF